jgi:hypothetical protein
MVQEFTVVSQTGSVAGQLALESQPHVLLFVLHVGWFPVHAVALVEEHCSHLPDTQARRAPVGQARVAPEPASPLQAAHVDVAESHTGAASGQSLLVAHPQVFVVRQIGEFPLQAVALVAEHVTHCPATHAGAAAPVHGSDVPDPKSPLHARHTLVVASQIGAVDGHSELLEQPQVPEEILHTGVVPVHAVELVEEHCPQVPEPRQARLVEVGQACAACEPLSPSQA